MRKLRSFAVGMAVTVWVAIPTIALAGAAPAGGAIDRTNPNEAAAAAAWGVDAASGALMRQQAAGAAAADALRRDVAGLPGFTSVGLDVDVVVLRWKGTPNPGVATAIDRASRQPGGRVKVRLVSATYSSAELSAAAERLRSTIESGHGNGLHAISVLTDGSGLQLSVDGVAGAPAAAPSLLIAQTIQSAGVGVTTTVVSAPRMRSLSRENDFPPWAGGAMIRDREPSSAYVNTTCTSGWGVRTPSGATYILTAGHCGQYLDQFRDPTGEWVGRVATVDQSRDLMLIQASAAGEIYVGGPPGTAQGIKGVAGWSYPYYGESICHSGAATGNVCGLVIEATDDIRCDVTPAGQWKCFGPLLRARRTNGTLAGRVGDSGGPVYYAYGSRVVALGTITGGDDGALIWFPSFSWAYQDWGVTPLTRSF